MKLTIKIASEAEYTIWSKLECQSVAVILVEANKQSLQLVFMHYLLSCVPYNYQQYCGRGFYLIKELFQQTDESTGVILYYAGCLYKFKTNDSFNIDAEVLLYLNPLYTLNSIGRKDFELEKLIGATIEILKPFVTSSYKGKRSYTSFNYKWNINSYPDEQDDTYLKPVEEISGLELSEEEMAYLEM